MTRHLVIRAVNNQRGHIFLKEKFMQIKNKKFTIALFLLLSPTLSFAKESENTLFPNQAIYFDNGYSFGIVTDNDDREFVNDNLWIDARLGYQLNKHWGIHLTGSYFISSMKDMPVKVSVNYFQIGPGVKYTYPLNDRIGFFGDLMFGYGKLSVSVDDFGVSLSASQSGFATATDMGITFKVARWGGLSPYIGFNTFAASTNGDWEASTWLTVGGMLNFSFDLNSYKKKSPTPTISTTQESPQPIQLPVQQVAPAPTEPTPIQQVPITQTTNINVPTIIPASQIPDSWRPK